MPFATTRGSDCSPQRAEPNRTDPRPPHGPVRASTRRRLRKSRTCTRLRMPNEPVIVMEKSNAVELPPKVGGPVRRCQASGGGSGGGAESGGRTGAVRTADAVAGLEQFALDPAVAQRGFSRAIRTTSAALGHPTEAGRDLVQPLDQVRLVLALGDPAPPAARLRRHAEQQMRQPSQPHPTVGSGASSQPLPHPGRWSITDRSLLLAEADASQRGRSSCRRTDAVNA
jgi:hypothetical protein